MNWLDIVGHENNIKLLKGMLDKDAVPHALLFVGPEGIGKFQLAKVLAKPLLCPKVASSCQDCQQCLVEPVDQNIDLVIIKPDNDVIKIEQVRKLQQDLILGPHKAKRKVIIIDNADKMTVQTANSLLKTLEEPANNIIFILIATKPEALLDTIKSRCQIMNFQPISPNILEKYLVNEKGVSLAEAAVVSRVSGGRISKALELLSEDGLIMRKLAFKIVNALPKMRKTEVWEYGNKVVELERSQIVELLVHVKMLLRDILILHYDEQDTLLYNIDLTAELKEQIKYWSDYQLVWVQKEIARSIQAIEANANLKLIIEAMLIKVIDELQRR